MTELDDRLIALERRVRVLEHALAGDPRLADPPARPQPQSPPERGAPRSPAAELPQATESLRAPAEEPATNFATQVLGFSGVLALILAASYLVRLAVASGWLTPARQLAIAAVSGIGLVAGGLALRRTGRRYASLLSAAGIVVLFIAVYGGHLFYGLIEPRLATGLVAALCLLTLGLGRVFDASPYALIAVLGAYATPFLTGARAPDIFEIVLYYSGWSALFCGYSLWIGGRHAYLMAMLLAVVGFDLVWRVSGSPDRVVAILYQASQFLLFTATTAYYAVRHRAPLTAATARAHAPALFIFYAIEYALLDAELPGAAPWITLASVLVVVAAYRLVKNRIPGNATAGATLVSWYAALVLFHSGYLEIIPREAQPWLALGLFVGFGLWVSRAGAPRAIYRPLVLAGALVCVLNYLRVLADMRMFEVPWTSALYVAYPAVLYGGYARTRSALSAPDERWRGAMLYAGHVVAMVAASRVVDASVLVSMLWGAIAITSLVVAWRVRDRSLARSSFLVFGASGLKVMLLDLQESAPLVRIGCLAILGISLYAGGWIYQRIADADQAGEDS